MSQTVKHRWSLFNTFMLGITADAWWALLLENRFAVDRVFWHRAALISLLSLPNSIFRFVEELVYRDRIANTEIEENPLFILGHWRSGTTYLHSLFAQDTDNFSYPNTYQVANPYTFLSTEAFNTKWIKLLAPTTRGVDNVSFGLDRPEEDEFALLFLTSCSPYLAYVFPKRTEYYNRYLTFRSASEEDKARWKEALRWFMQKLTLRANKALVLKSPAHMARIPLLLELFPQARFVHIHRNPYEVFRSTRHSYDSAAWHMYLQMPQEDAIEDLIIQRYNIVHDTYFNDRPLIPSSQFCEMSFEGLRSDPVAQMRAVYEQLGIRNFAACERPLLRYLYSISDYRMNKYPDLKPCVRNRIAREWRRCFDEWEYAI